MTIGARDFFRPGRSVAVGTRGMAATSHPDATLAAEPITSYASTHSGAEAYRQLARELIARGGAP